VTVGETRARETGTPERAKPDRSLDAVSITASRLAEDWKEAAERAMAWLCAGEVPAEQRASLVDAALLRAASMAWPPGGDAVWATMAAVRELGPAPVVAPDLPGALRSSMPPLSRGSMVPDPLGHGLFGRWMRRFSRRSRRPPPTLPPHRPLRGLRRELPWIGAARRRRLLLMGLVAIPSVVASAFMVNVLPHQGRTALEVAIVVFFGALFGWISVGFWTALIGFVSLVRGGERYSITSLVPDGDDTPIDPSARTAIVMPICHEPVDRVFAGLRAIHDSLERTGQLRHFDFFVLSDSAEPDTWVAEEEAWARWCRDTNGFGRLFYRRRRVRLRRKSGNVSDFCRHWGRAYRYMVMLDADSVMSGAAIVRLVRMMERKPDAGMIQTAPVATGRRSLLARVQQFSGRLYGAMFAAGLHHWQLGDGQYWGHNAIIRIAPFMEHCALPVLPGKPPLGGAILSHDFVEAALMGRAGWTLWLAWDLEGSWEEVPSTLLEEMTRDRRWCQGNLQHLRLLFSEGLFGAHRALFVNGVLSYVSALLWFGFLTLSTTEALHNVLVEPDYFPDGPSLFPEWPVWRPDWAYALMAVTAAILFLPKLLGVFLVVRDPVQRRAFGGTLRLLAGVFLEVILSSLLAPIRMVFHSRFVVQTLLGRSVSWGSPSRDDTGTGWAEALRRHGFDTLFACAWAALLLWLNPDYFWWVTPIVGALLLSVPLSVLTSRVSAGDRARRLGLFLIPEESDPPPEWRSLAGHLERAAEATAALPPAERDGLVRVAVDPAANAGRRARLPRRRSLRPDLRIAREALLEQALERGPATLPSSARRVLLEDPDLVAALHERVWALADRTKAAMWGRPGGSDD
jgi:membrane glycosyltransferase